MYEQGSEEQGMMRIVRESWGQGLVRALALLMVFSTGPWYELMLANPFDAPRLGARLEHRLEQLLDFVVPAAHAQLAVCDIDVDGDIDLDDINGIMARRNQPASGPDDPADADGDGIITANDARQCVLQCTLPRCAIVTANNPPVADAGADQTASVGTPVTLDGSASSDLDGEALTFSWDFVSVPAASSAVLDDPTSVAPSFTIDLAGDYVIQLIVNDGTDDSDPDTITVSTVNSKPVADAGADQSGFLGDTITLDGTGSSDVDGDPLTYSWSLPTVPAGSGAALDDPTGPMPGFVIDVFGDYIAELIVNDATVDSAPDTVTITTDNSAPVADAGAAQSAFLGDTVTLDGTGSADVDGDALTYSWSLQSVPAGSTAVLSDPAAAMPLFVVDLFGEYVAQLVVNDGTVDSAPDTVTITTENSAPVADAGPDQRSAVGDIVVLDGSASSDAEFDPLTFSWSFTLRPAGSSAALSDATAVSPTFVADHAGTYVVQLIVNDATVDSAPDTVVITALAIVPDVVGQSQAAAGAAIVGVGLTVGTVTTQHSDIVPAGDVISQDPPAGTSVTTGSAVDLVVSSGPALVAVPDVVGQSQAAAEAAIVGAGLTVGTVTTQHSDIVPAGDVIGQYPGAGAAVALGSAVDLVVSSGTALVSVPDVAGLDQASAESAIVAAGLVVGTVTTQASDTVPAGEVIDQDPLGGTGVSPGSAVNLVVSSGPADSANAEIGPSGGTVSLPDGARVVIPAGALANTVTISVERIAPVNGAVLPSTGVVVGDTYSFEPDGQEFLVPVEMTIPYDRTLLPADYEEGAISIYRLDPGDRFHMVGSENGGDFGHPESNGQDIDTVNQTVTVLTSHFTAYGAIGVNSISDFVPMLDTVAGGNASVTMHVPNQGGLRTEKPWSHNCRTRSDARPLPARTATDGIVIHSTNSANPRKVFNNELAWATDNCNLFFAHFYINRDGNIYKIVGEDRDLNHIGDTARLGLDNQNTVGIELYNNVGEPYDGRQIAALVRLIDVLLERYNLPRPTRDPMTGLYARNRIDITTGGERIITHFDYNGKCDPIGFMRDAEVYYPVNRAQGCAMPSVSVPNSNPDAPALLDAIFDSLAVLDRAVQHTGVVNTSGGDSVGPADAGVGGAVTFSEDAAAVSRAVGAAELTTSGQNDPLVVAPNTTRSDLSGVQTFTDVIVAGTLEVTGSLELQLTGVFYLSPSGKVILRDGDNGGALTVISRGVPIVQGLIDTRGENGSADPSPGGNGGAVSFTYAYPGAVLMPTIITRGGDRQLGNTQPGGSGGDITIQSDTSHVFFGGGMGPRINDVGIPPIRSGALPPMSPTTPDYAGDELSPPPPFNLTSIGIGNTPMPGARTPLIRAGFQQGFTRGLLTSGGIGGAILNAGVTAAENKGGPGGAGGDISISSNATITFHDVDFLTGADVEMLTSDLFFPNFVFGFAFFAPSGSTGGLGAPTNVPRGGDGGPGGAAGSISLAGNFTLQPEPARFDPVGGLGGSGDIIGLNGGPLPGPFDDPFSSPIGTLRQAMSASGEVLYRVRVDASDQALGGSGGLPGSGWGVFFFSPGAFGDVGSPGQIVGLPVR